jgi:hypothetical protein
MYEKKNRNTLNKIVEGDVQGGGPFFVKMLQKMSNNSFVSHTHDVQPMGENELNFITSLLISNNTNECSFKNMNMNVLSSSGFTQAHVMKNRFGKNVVVKFLRPANLYYFLCECNFLLVTVWKKFRLEANRVYPNNNHLQTKLTKQCRHVMLHFMKEVCEEFDYKKKAQCAIVGCAIYNHPHMMMHSSKLLQYTVTPFPMIIQTYEGNVGLDGLLKKCEKMLKHSSKENKIKHYINTIVVPMIHRSMVTLLESWFKNIFSRSVSCFHGDLHLGNLRTLSMENLIRLHRLKAETRAPLYIIDYGHCYFLNKKLRYGLLDVMLTSGRMKHPGCFKSYNEKNKKKLKWKNETKQSPIKIKLTKEILKCYASDYPSLSAEDKKRLLNGPLSSSKVHRIHTTNKKVMKTCIKKLFKLSKVPLHLTSKDFEMLSKKMLNYSDFLTFGHLLLRFVKHVQKIGVCVGNPVIAFAKNVSLLSNNLKAIESLCKDTTFYPSWEISPFVTGQMLKNVAQFTR